MVAEYDVLATNLHAQTLDVSQIPDQHVGGTDSQAATVSGATRRCTIMVQRIAAVPRVHGAAVAAPVRRVDDFHIEVHVRGEIVPDTQTHPLLHEHEVNHTQRLIDYLDVVKTPHSDAFDLPKLHNDFREFYTQYDQRRNKDFASTFPILKEWYDSL